MPEIAEQGSVLWSHTQQRDTRRLFGNEHIRAWRIQNGGTWERA